ncbi:MAG: dihydropteroate synthase [Chthonomonadales bacterium]
MEPRSMEYLLAIARHGTRTLVMGILNVTPDSFSDGGRYLDPDAAVRHGLQMAEEGADLIDIGGESTRPGAEPLTVDQELERVLPVIRELSARCPVPLSIDTYKAAVARRAVEAGAAMVNDISAMTFDADMAATVADLHVPVILMHIKGTPRTMQQDPRYTDVVAEVREWLAGRVEAAAAAGISREHIFVDPGFGFGKTAEQNLELLRRLREFGTLGLPVALGTSRKSTIGKVLGGLPVEERLEGTAATVALAIAGGAALVRVHDVREMVRVVRMADAVVRGWKEDAVG